MGCSSPKEQLEDKIMDLNIDKIEVQMERYNQMKLLGQNKNTNKAKQIKFNTINNTINNTNSNINNSKIKRTTIRAKTTKEPVKPVPTKTGKGRRGKSVKTAGVKSNINNI